MHDLWPQQCITFWSWVLPTKCGGHRALLSKIDPYLTPADPYMAFEPQQCITVWSGILPTKFGGHRAFLSNLTLVDPGWPLHDLWPQQCTTLWSGVLLTKFGCHRALLRQIDPWMTFDPRWGRFENMPTNLVGPSPTPMPTFSSIPQSMTKRIAGHTHTYTHTHLHTPPHRLHYFNSIDLTMKLQSSNYFHDLTN